MAVEFDNPCRKDERVLSRNASACDQKDERKRSVVNPAFECMHMCMCVCMCVCVCVCSVELLLCLWARVGVNVCMNIDTGRRMQTQTNKPNRRTAVSCSVLQCVAVCCSVLQCAAVCCSACSALQCRTNTPNRRTTVCCSALQCNACSAL